MRWVLLVLLLGITGLQVPALLVADNTLWAVAVHAAPTTLLWLQYTYRYAPTLRLKVVMALAQFSNHITSMRIVATFTVDDNEVTDRDVITIIQECYPPVMGRTAIKVLPSGAYTIVEMPGWTARFAFSTPTAMERDDDDMLDARDLTITLPDTKNAIGSSLNLLQSDVLPLLERLERELPAKLASLNMSIRFVNAPNPYLAAYLQNVDLERIQSLKCIVKEDKGGEAEIQRDRIVLRAGSLGDLRNLAQKHLKFQWSGG